jgi:hypothetical protein
MRTIWAASDARNSEIPGCGKQLREFTLGREDKLQDELGVLTSKTAKPATAKNFAARIRNRARRLRRELPPYS